MILPSLIGSSITLSANFAHVSRVRYHKSRPHLRKDHRYTFKSKCSRKSHFLITHFSIFNLLFESNILNFQALFMNYKLPMQIWYSFKKFSMWFHIFCHPRYNSFFIISLRLIHIAAFREWETRILCCIERWYFNRYFLFNLLY